MSRRVTITATSTNSNSVLTLLAAIDADILSATFERFSAGEALITRPHPRRPTALLPRRHA